MEKVIERIRRLSEECDALSLSFDGFVYNPLSYGWPAHLEYQRRALQDSCHVMFLGMNPGPDGMAQTAVPFGSVSACRDYLGIDMPVGHPAKEHPRKPVDGFSHRKDEPSGAKIWGLIREHYPDPSAFFSFATVQNFCPLCFLDKERGRNVTPDKLERSDREKLEAVCRGALSDILSLLGIDTAVAVGTYAEKQLKLAAPSLHIVRILHPSPITGISPQEWRERSEAVLHEEGIF